MLDVDETSLDDDSYEEQLAQSTKQELLDAIEKLSQKDLATKLNVPLQTIVQYENGKAIPNNNFIRKMEVILNIKEIAEIQLVGPQLRLREKLLKKLPVLSRMNVILFASQN